MSINFNDPMNDEAKQMMKDTFGDQIAYMDSKTALIDRMEIMQSEMSKLANVAEQVVTVELNEPGEIKTMADGTQYRVTPQGWRKVKA